MVGAMPVNLIPKFCNGTMDSHNGTEDSEFQVHIGSRVKCNDDFATVKYIGEVQGYKGVWYGVEWDDPARGKHDGSMDDVQYFKTSKPGAGSFIRPNKIAQFKTCAEAIRKYYGDKEDETVAAHRRTVINEWKREMGAPFIEMVGFEKIRQKQKFDRLLEVCVNDQNVTKAGDLSSLCPHARSMDVSRNLFSNWREVIQLAAQLPDMRELDVSKNRMAIDMQKETLTHLSVNFASLEKLNISICDYEWSDLLTLSHLWPKVGEIIAAYNRIKTITPPQTTLRTLTILRLDGNPLDSWYEVMNLGRLKTLKTLSLNDCFIEEIRFNDDPDCKLDMFENLEVLFLNRNRIKDWRSISELDKLKNLKKLYFLKNPIQDSVDYDTGSQLITAKIGKLQILFTSTMKTVKLSRAIVATAIVGVMVSTYALYVEMAAEARPGYKALCDIAEYASCSRVLTSEYSKGFGIIPKDSALEVPNCIYGTLFYCLMILLATYDHIGFVRLQLLLSLASCASSVYLAYLLAFVLHDVCVVCISTYFVNGALLWLVYKKSKLVADKNKQC